MPDRIAGLPVSAKALLDPSSDAIAASRRCLSRRGGKLCKCLPHESIEHCRRTAPFPIGNHSTVSTQSGIEPGGAATATCAVLVDAVGIRCDIGCV